MRGQIVAASRTACCIFLSLCTAGNRFVLTRSDVAVPMRFRFVENATVVRRMSMSGVIDAVQFAVSATESTRLGALRHDTYTAGATDVPHTTGGAGTIFDWVIRINNQMWPIQPCMLCQYKRHVHERRQKQPTALITAPILALEVDLIYL